jgi:MazG family protein
LAPKDRLEALVRVLRGPEGCPWDQRQTAASIIDFVIDEAHELKEALSRPNSQAEVTEELGDLAFTFTFLCQTLGDLATEAAAVESVVGKMIVRHPHVFAPEGEAVGESEIKRKWESLKMEKAPASRRLDRDLPASLGAWKKAAKILTRASNAGFRYPSPQAAWEKVAEEWGELQEALDAEASHDQTQAELGDLLLALLTAAQQSGLDAESALLSSGKKLADRLERIEELSGLGLSDIAYHDLADWYQRARQETEVPQAYFNYCGVSLWPGEVSRALSRAARAVARQGLPGSLALRQQREDLKQKIAHLVGAAEETATVVLVPNVSSAALAVGYCLDWQAGDQIVLGSQEFPANTVPWRSAAETFHLKVHNFDEDRLRSEPETAWAELERRLLKTRPRLLALSLVSYWSGYRLPIERLTSVCQSSGTLLYLDAIQALGTAPVALPNGVDFLAGGSHKGLLAPEGAGFLVVSARVRRHWVPRLAGWLSLPDPVDFLVQGDPNIDPNGKEPRPHDPTTLEAGSQNALGYAGLSGALDYLRQGGGVEAIFQHVQALHDTLEAGLTELGFRSLRSDEISGRSAILSFDPPSGIDLARLQSALSLVGVEVSIPKGRLRFGCHRPNTTADVLRALAAMPAALELARIPL